MKKEWERRIERGVRSVRVRMVQERGRKGVREVCSGEQKQSEV